MTIYAPKPKVTKNSIKILIIMYYLLLQNIKHILNLISQLHNVR
jgi:hypothetical protein